jgi:hypothetical protein
MFHFAQQTFPHIQAIDWYAAGRYGLSAFGGALLALVGAYLALARDVTYIKGKLDQLTSDHDKYEDLRTRIERVEYGLKHENMLPYVSQKSRSF